MKIFLFIIVALSSLRACGDPSLSLIPVKIALEWFLNPHHAPFIVADTNGYFKDEGLAVTFYPANGSQEGCRQAAQGIVDFAITHEPQVFILKAKGMLIDPVATLIPDTLEVVISHVPMDQLKGKTIAHGSSGAGSLTFAVMDQFLEHAHLKQEDISIIIAKNCLVSGFLSGKIDAVFNIYRTYQLHDIRKYITKPFYVHEFKDFGVPLFASMVLVCGRSIQTDMRRRMQRALQKAVDFIHDYPDKAYDCVRGYRPELDTRENRDVWSLVHPTFARDVLLERVEQQTILRQFLKKVGLL
jgi:putative hydroxymethylpyrimidine transport system substrate-binding protein